MNTKSTFNRVFLNGKWLTTFGLILLGIGVLLAITVNSQAFTFNPPAIGPDPAEALASNPEIFVAGRYAPRVHTSTGVLLSPLTQVQVAEAARYQALVGHYVNMFGSTAWTRATQPLSRAQIAEAARYQALAGQHYNL